MYTFRMSIGKQEDTHSLLQSAKLVIETGIAVAEDRHKSYQQQIHDIGVCMLWLKA